MRLLPLIALPALAIVALYMLARAALVAALPVHTQTDWSRLDAWKTAPRLAAFLVLWELNRRRWKTLRLDFASPGGIVRTTCWTAGAILAYGLSCAGPVADAFSARTAILGLAATPFVALFEEYAFRGAILEGLLPFVGACGAVLGSALLFAVYHVQAQPAAAWPALFGLGVILANLRLRGIGLGWLMIVHAILDGLFFWGTRPYWGTTSATFLAFLTICAFVSWPRRLRVD